MHVCLNEWMSENVLAKKSFNIYLILVLILPSLYIYSCFKVFVVGALKGHCEQTLITQTQEDPGGISAEILPHLHLHSAEQNVCHFAVAAMRNNSKNRFTFMDFGIGREHQATHRSEGGCGTFCARCLIWCCRRSLRWSRCLCWQHKLSEPQCPLAHPLVPLPSDHGAQTRAGCRWCPTQWRLRSPERREAAAFPGQTHRLWSDETAGLHDQECVPGPRCPRPHRWRKTLLQSQSGNRRPSDLDLLQD